MGVVPGAVDRDQTHGGQSSLQGGGDLEVHPGVSGLGRVQIGDVAPVPGGADGAIHQHGSSSHQLLWVGHELGEDLPDQRAQQIPAPAHGGLADAEDRSCEGLGDVRAHQTHHQRHRSEQAQRIGTAVGGEPFPTGGLHSHHQFDELLSAQSCHSLVPQRLLRIDFAVWSTTKQNDRSCCPSSMTRTIHRLCRNCDLTFSRRTVRLTRSTPPEGL